VDGLSRPKGLIEPLRVQAQVPQDLPVEGEDPHVPLGHQHEHAGPLITPPDGHVVEPAAVTQGHVAGVDAVLARSGSGASP
jgi:hypothetical protein